MKKILVCLLVVISLIGMACRTPPPPGGDDEEDNQEEIFTPDPPYTPPETPPSVAEDPNTALGEIYDNYRHNLDLTGARDYTVARGNTLSDITRNYYGDLTGVGNAGPRNGFYFPVIMLASDPDSEIYDPDLIEPGMHLTIIDLQRNLANPVSRQAIKDCLLEVAAVYDVKGIPQTPRGATARLSAQGLRDLANSL